MAGSIRPAKSGQASARARTASARPTPTFLVATATADTIASSTVLARQNRLSTSGTVATNTQIICPGLPGILQESTAAPMVRLG